MLNKLPLIALSLGILGVGLAGQKPKVSYVILTGGARGNLSPCGCTKPMTGGLKRLGTMVRELKARYGATWIDLGDVTKEPGRQSELKLEAYGQFLGQLKVDAFVISDQDARLGEGSILSYQSLAKGVALEGNSATSLVRGVRFTTDREAAAEISMVPNRLAKVEVFKSGGAASAQGRRVTVGEGLRGLILLKFVNGKLESSRAIELEPGVVDDAKTAKVYASYLRRVTNEQLADRGPKAPGGDYVGSEKCASCHQEAAKVHFASMHAKAIPTLEKEGHQADPDCLSCHTVGFGEEGGYFVKDRLQFGEVGCESCHGEGGAHSAAPKDHPLGKVPQQTCLKCHTSKTSPGFNFLTFWSKIKH